MSDLEHHQRLAYRLKEVEELIGIPVSTLRALIRKGELNPCTGFGTWLITHEELQRLLSKRLRPNASNSIQ